MPETLSTRLFRSRLALINTIDQKTLQEGDRLAEGLVLHRHELAELLRCHVAACPALQPQRGPGATQP